MTTVFAARLSSVFQSSPLRHAPFRLFYFGSVATALGYTMQATVAAWLMATLTPSPLMVALVQTASTAPALLFGLLAGTLADIVHRRKIIGATQVVLLIATAMLGGATLAAIIGPGTLLVLTFLVGIGFTFYMPAQQASINELVSRAELPRAVTHHVPVLFRRMRRATEVRECPIGRVGQIGERIGQRPVQVEQHPAFLHGEDIRLLVGFAP